VTFDEEYPMLSTACRMYQMGEMRFYWWLALLPPEEHEQLEAESCAVVRYIEETILPDWRNLVDAFRAAAPGIAAAAREMAQQLAALQEGRE